MEVLFDTNVLMIPGQFRLDVFEDADRLCFDMGGAQPVVLQNTIGELASKSKGGGKDAAACRIAIKLIKARKIRVDSMSAYKADDAILQWSEQKMAKGAEIAVATIDSSLKKKLKKIGVRVICLKNKSGLGWA